MLGLPSLQALQDMLQSDAHVWMVCMGLVGLLLGSFLNVVIHRLPKMMELQWASERDASAEAPLQTQPKYNLVTPRSACGHCGHAIRWHENIPVLSFLFLQGRCSACHSRISWRYPLVEIITCLIFVGCAARWGVGLASFAYAGFASILLVLALIDWDTTLLPDDLTLDLLWAGLIVQALGWLPASSLSDALWGAVFGYGSLWLIFWAFKLATGKEGMGYGDFKLLAAIGAWLGWQALIPVILLSSVVGSVVGIALKLQSQLREGGYVPFGPFLAGGAALCLWWGHPQVMKTIFSVLT